MKEVYALTKNLRLMVLFDFEALSRVLCPKTLLKTCRISGSSLSVRVAGRLASRIATISFGGDPQ